jgi:hypothetical protein
MKAFGAGGDATCVPTFRKTDDQEPRPPPCRQESVTSAEGRMKRPSVVPASAPASPAPALSGGYVEPTRLRDRVARMAEGWRSVRLEEIEPIPVVGGTLFWRPVRRTLDIGAFGINSYVAPNAGDDVVEEHTEESLGHEEVYVVLSGHATFELDGETLDAPPGTLVFVSDPKVKRHAKATEPSAWEDFFAAERHRASGDYDAYADEIAEALERRPDHPATLYNLACAEALAGRSDAALEHLRRAIQLRPDFAASAQRDDDFASLHGHAEWPIEVG